MSDLNKIIRSIITQPKQVFFSDLKEALEERVDSVYSKKYENVKKALFELTIKEEILKTPEPIKPVISEQVDNFIGNLKECYFENKTILHKFRDGNTVAITPEDSISLVQMHDSLNIMNQQKMRNLMSESFGEYNKILKFSKKHRKD